MTQLKEMSLPGAHSRIIAIMQEMERGAVLDAPAGAGALSLRLSDAGFQISCCDIDSGNFHCADRFQLQNADFNVEKLPYKDANFDYIICANGLHRLYNPRNIIQEFARVMKPDGVLILSWPNYNSMARRVAFLLRGTIGGSIDRAEYDQTISEPGAQVRFPLSTGRVAYLLAQHGVEIERIFSTNMRFYEYLLSPVSVSVSLLGKLFGFGSRDNQLAVIIGGSTTIAVCRKKQSDASAAA